VVAFFTEEAFFTEREQLGANAVTETASAAVDENFCQSIRTTSVDG
jgi:hypothetical protein